MNKSILFCAAVVVALPACSSSSNDGSNNSNPSVGGSPNSSGGASTSALGSTGGTSSTSLASGGGGSSALGGSSSVGGSVGTGGRGSATGGAGTGGQTSTKSATGGMSTVNSVTGGTKATGGSTGSVSSGGTTTTQPGTATGGTKATGGTTSTSGIGGSTAAAGGNTSAAGGTQAAGGSAGSPTGGSTAVGCVPAPTTYPNLFVTVSGHTQEESDSKVSKAWSSLFNPSGSGTIYYNGPGSDESYVQDIYNNDVRSEGMSYGMMVAVQLDHQTEFDRLWTWVRNHMAQNCSGDKCTGEIAWSCQTSGSKKSTGGAPDGEEYFATALIFAHNRWGDTGKYKYATEAQWVLDLIRTKYFHTNPHIVKFGSMSNVSDPSYVLPAFYQTWACFDTANAAFWNTAVADGRKFFHNDVDSNGVCPYQANWDGSQTAGANSDSVRCVVNIMMDYNFFKADPWQSETYAPKFAAHERNAGPPSSYCDALLGFGLPTADGKAFVDKIWSANVPSHDYWNGVLYMLALLHVSGNFKLYY